MEPPFLPWPGRLTSSRAALDSSNPSQLDLCDRLYMRGPLPLPSSALSILCFPTSTIKNTRGSPTTSLSLSTLEKRRAVSAWLSKIAGSKVCKVTSASSTLTTKTSNRLYKMSSPASKSMVSPHPTPILCRVPSWSHSASNKQHGAWPRPLLRPSHSPLHEGSPLGGRG